MSSELIKVSAVIIVVAVFATVLRNRLGEYSILLVITTISILLVFIFGNLFSAIATVRNLFYKSGNISVYFTTALKALGISYISTFASDICRDFGLSALAQTSEITGKIMIFILSLPLVSSVLEAALKFAGL